MRSQQRETHPGEGGDRRASSEGGECGQADRLRSLNRPTETATRAAYSGGRFRVLY